MSEARARRYKIVIVYPFVKDSLLMERLHERNKKQNRVLKPSIARRFVKLAQENFVHYLDYADAGYLYNNNIDKSEYGKYSLPWLMKFHRNDNRKDFKCSPEICQFEIWRKLVDEYRNNTPICQDVCSSTEYDQENLIP